MKAIPLRSMKQELSRYVDKAQKDYIVITRYGRPAAVVWGVEGHDFEDIFYMTNRAFWATIRRRRTQPAVPFAKAKRRLMV
ncbi:MAG: type II toxin-antitoxin system Phd/YefM family antitoxin [Deltaproteobacteria bacterium]|nr:type II toxin-antitoxin system Phd/YefM family antitoxin [Deltaproteobacteria bacterium]